MSTPVDALGTRRYTRNGTSSHSTQVRSLSSTYMADGNDDQNVVIEQDHLSQFEYICIAQPTWDRQVCDDWFVFEDDYLPGNTSTLMRHKLELEAPGKLAADYPAWRWRMMRVSQDMVAEWRDHTRACEVRHFGSFLHNDFFACSLQEAQENILVRFDDEFRKDGKSFLMLWAIMVSLMHWELHEQSNWSPHGRDEKTSETFGLVGCAFLTVLNEIQQAKQLRSDSLLEDLGLVMCMALEWARSQASHGVRNEDLVWREYVVAYAKKGKIDLVNTPLQNASELVTILKANRKRVGIPRADRWGWRQKFDHFVSRHGTSDGDWNVTPVGHLETITQL